MNKLLVLLSVFGLTAALVGCITFGSIVGRGPVETRDQNFTNFSRLEVSSGFKLRVTRSPTFAVSVSANQNLFDYLDFVQSGDTLFIKLKPGSYTFGTLEARVSMPDLSALSLSGASRGTVGGFSFSHSLAFDISGASNLELDSMNAGDLTAKISGASRLSGVLACGAVSFNVSGASRVELSGSGGGMNLTASGASSVGLRDFTIGATKVNLSGASSSSVITSAKLDADVSGASHLTYYGNPSLGVINVTGASSISKG